MFAVLTASSLGAISLARSLLCSFSTPPPHITITTRVQGITRESGRPSTMLPQLNLAHMNDDPEKATEMVWDRMHA